LTTLSSLALVTQTTGMASLKITSYMFRCLLHHLQGDHYVTCSKIISFLKCFTYLMQ